MYCISCGKELQENSQFCSGCGRPTGNNEASAATSVANPAGPKLQNGFAWALASGPLFIFVIEIAMYQQMTLSDVTAWSYFVGFIVNSLFMLLDVAELKKANLYKTGEAFWAFFLVPIYLYRRARITRMHQGMLVLWLFLFVISLFSHL